MTPDNDRPRGWQAPMQGQGAARVPFSPCPDYQRAVTALVFRRDPSITLGGLRAMQADLEARRDEAKRLEERRRAASRFLDDGEVLE